MAPRFGSYGRLRRSTFPVCHGLERDSATIRAGLTTVPSRAEVWVDRAPQSGPRRAGCHDYS